MEPKETAETSEAAKDPSAAGRVDEDGDHMADWDVDNDKHDPYDDLNSHHSSMCSSP